MDNDTFDDLPIQFGSSQISTLPMLKTIASSDENMEGSQQVMLISSPNIKVEPEEDMEEELMDSERSERPSTPSKNFNDSMDYSLDQNSMSSNESLNSSTHTSSSIGDPWSTIKTVNQEPDVIIERDEADSETIPLVHSNQVPHPVMLIKSSTPKSKRMSAKKQRTLKESAEVDKNVKPGWFQIVNKKASCYVCNGPCKVTRNRKIPTLPFCKKCKKAYFYQLSHEQKQSRKKKIKPNCMRGGNCIIDFRFPKEWCSVCHFRKFRTILNGKDMEIDGDENQLEETRKRIQAYRHKYFSSGASQPKPKITKKDCVEDPLKSIDKELVLKVPKLTSEDLQAYGVTVSDESESESIAVKQEPNWNFEAIIASPNCSVPQVQTDSPLFLSNVMDQNMFRSQTITTLNSRYKKPRAQSKKPNANANKSKKVPKTKDYLRSSGTQKDKKLSKAMPKSAAKKSSQPDTVASIKVYVYTCGHACGTCNPSTAKQWLAESGIETAPAVRNYDNFPVTSSHIRSILERPPCFQHNQPLPKNHSLLNQPPQMCNVTQRFPVDTNTNTRETSQLLTGSLPSLSANPSMKSVSSLPIPLQLLPIPSSLSANPSMKSVSSLPIPLQLLPIPPSLSANPSLKSVSSAPIPLQLLPIPSLPGNPNVKPVSSATATLQLLPISSSLSANSSVNPVSSASGTLQLLPVSLPSSLPAVPGIHWMRVSTLPATMFTPTGPVELQPGSSSPKLISSSPTPIQLTTASSITPISAISAGNSNDNVQLTPSINQPLARKFQTPSTAEVPMPISLINGQIPTSLSLMIPSVTENGEIDSDTNCSVIPSISGKIETSTPLSSESDTELGTSLRTTIPTTISITL